MRVRQLSVASAELREAMTWYRARSPRAAENLWLRVQECAALNTHVSSRRAADRPKNTTVHLVRLPLRPDLLRAAG